MLNKICDGVWSIITKCYDNEKEIPCPSPGEPFYGQDGNYSYGSTGINILNISSGVKVECINFLGENIINMVGDLPSIL